MSRSTVAAPVSLGESARATTKKKSERTRGTPMHHVEHGEQPALSLVG